jgi:hypothetical protein
VRVFVVHSDERAEFEHAQRVKAMDCVPVRLEKLQRRVAQGRSKRSKRLAPWPAEFSTAIMATAITAGGPARMACSVCSNIHGLLALTLVGVWGLSTLSVIADDADRCVDAMGREGITACDRVIASDKLGGSELAFAYYNRGFAKLE